MTCGDSLHDIVNIILVVVEDQQYINYRIVDLVCKHAEKPLHLRARVLSFILLKSQVKLMTKAKKLALTFCCIF